MSESRQSSYFDGLILSNNKTTTFKATEGVMRKGQLPQEIEANAGREQITVTMGTLQYKPQNSAEWQTKTVGETFMIPSGEHFLWKVDEGEMHYECVYLDRPIA